MEVSEDVQRLVKEQRLKQLEQQIADVVITITIYHKMIDTYGENEDRAQLSTELTKLGRLKLAYEAVEGV